MPSVMNVYINIDITKLGRKHPFIQPIPFNYPRLNAVSF